MTPNPGSGETRLTAKAVAGLINNAFAQAVGSYLITGSIPVVVTVAVMATVLVGCAMFSAR